MVDYKRLVGWGVLVKREGKGRGRGRVKGKGKGKITYVVFESG